MKQSDTILYASDITDLTTRKYGFVKAAREDQALPQDLTPDAIYDNLTSAGGVFVKSVTVPAGTRRLVVQITAATARDLDLYVHRDGTNGQPRDGIPSEPEQVCAPYTLGALEYCNIVAPAPGAYLILIQNVVGSGGSMDPFTLATVLLPTTDAGTMTVTGPAAIPVSTPFTVDVGWNIPGAQAGDRWYGGFDLGSSASSPGDIVFVPVDLIRSTRPEITSQPANQQIKSGTTATLRVIASSDLPLEYQWYQGTAGDTNRPIFGATAGTFTTPALTRATSYWVRVSNAIGSVDSATATVTMITSPITTITPPAIITPPADQQVAPGTSATLSVAATGSAPLTYQWYQGQAGDTSALIAGATASSFTTPALANPTSYWVRVSNAAGSTDSRTATVQMTGIPSVPTLAATGGDHGKARSYFTFAGQIFGAGETVRIAVDGRTVLVLTTDTRGVLRFGLYFGPNAPARSYTVSAIAMTNGAQIAAANTAQTLITIDPAAQMLARPGDPTLPLANALPTIYLPIAIQ